MASTKEYLDFIMGQLSNLEKITYRAMMKEYITPEMEVMEINCQNELLMNSNLAPQKPDNDDIY